MLRKGEGKCFEAHMKCCHCLNCPLYQLPGRDYSSSSTFAKYAKILLDHLALWPSPYGAINMLYAALIDDADALAVIDGKYIQPWCSVLEPAALASDEQLAKQVWQHMEDTVEEERIAAGVQAVA